MRVLVAYMSESGRTKKVAEAIFDEIRADKEMSEISQVDSLDGYDLCFIGFPIQAFGPAQAAKEFLEKHAAGRNIALFITHAVHEDSEALQEWLGACRAAAAGANLVGMFDCQGELAESVAEALKSLGDPQLAAWADERSQTIGQPDEQRLERARAFAREMTARFST